MAISTRRYTLPQPNSPEQIQRMLRQSQIPHVISAQRILAPSINIALGSTPSRSMLEVMRHMLPMSLADRRKVAFVHIDTDSVPDDLVTFRKQHQGMFLEFISHISVPSHNEVATMPPQNIANHTLITPYIPKFFATGAGGIRNNGHVALAFNYFEVRETINQALTSIGLVRNDYDALAIDEVQVNIVSFLGGGTGSGILADIAVLIRDLLVNRSIYHRINLFCILPEHVQGSSNYEISWRRSNATATLLELLAYEVAASRSKSKTYMKYILSEEIEISEHYIANEIFLVGHTGLGDIEKVARVVGIDLFQRICDASGVGYWERSKWVDRRTLSAKDQRTLPTFFGQSCALEAVFPAVSTAQAYAEMSASYLLPTLVGTKPGEPQTAALEGDWQREIIQIAQLGTGSNPRTREVPLDVIEGRSNFADLRNDIDAELAKTERNIAGEIGTKRKQERDAIYGPPINSRDEMGMTLVQRKIQHLRRIKAKYAFWERILRDAPDLSDWPQTSIDKYQRPIPFLPDGFPGQEWARPARASALTNELNYYIYSSDEVQRYNQLKKLLEELNGEVEKALTDEEKWFNAIDVSIHQAQLRERALQSNAWHGELDMTHPHMRHIFDLPTLKKARGGLFNEDERDVNTAVETLYWSTTFPGLTAQDIKMDQLEKQFKDRFLAPCIGYISGHSNDTENESTTADLEEHGKEMLTQEVVAFFKDYYLHGIEGGVEGRQSTRGLNHYNLVTLLSMGTGSQMRPDLSEYLLAHLSHMREILRDYMAYEPGLEGSGYNPVDTTLYLAMRWEDTGFEERVLQKALDDLGPLLGKNQAAMKPSVQNLIDPHRMQVLYGIHGISITTINEFCIPRSSMMGDYLKKENAWFGVEQSVRQVSSPVRGHYGNNAMPVHSSGEMERLVCKQDLFFHTSDDLLDSSLRGQVIRDAESLAEIPFGWDDEPPRQDGRTPPGQGGPGYSDGNPGYNDPRGYRDSYRQQRPPNDPYE